MNLSRRRGWALGSIVMALVTALHGQTTPRRPRGVYAVVNLTSTLGLAQQANPASTQLQLDAYFASLYSNLLSDPAISGLALQVQWYLVNPNAPPAGNAYFWNYVDDAFAQVGAWNTQNPTSPPKTIQLLVTPGFQSPMWVTNQIPSCDGLFATPPQTPTAGCGETTFTGYQESGYGDVLPLPWNPLYKSLWKTFLIALNARYGSNPAFVSIAVSGPTAASDEMTTASNSTAVNPQTQFTTPISPNDMWAALFAFHYAGMPAYQNSDQAFIDEWDNAIDMYGQIFSGLTLVGTTGGGFPNFGGTNFTTPPAFAAECGSASMVCAAVTTILSYFENASVGGTNAKATQTSGMKKARAGIVDLGVTGVKFVSQSTSQLPLPSGQVLGGSQFDQSFSNDPLGEGCPAAFPPNANNVPMGCAIPATCTTENCLPVACIPQACLAPGVTIADLSTFGTFKKVPANDVTSPEQAEYNVLNYFFDGTPVASFFGATPGAAPLNYLQIYAPDILYSQTNAGSPAQIVTPDGSTLTMSAQDLMSLASAKLMELEEPVVLASGTTQPGLSLSTQQLQFWAYKASGTLPAAAQTVGVVNTGNGLFGWSATADQSWVTITQNASNFTVAVDPTGMKAGPYVGTISVVAFDGSDNPQTVIVTMNVVAGMGNTATESTRFIPITPCRIADTRNANGPFGGPTPAAQTERDFAIPSSACGIPGTAMAYSLNVAVVPQGPLGYLTLWPTGQPQPLVATLNSDGRVKSNAAIVPAGVSGSISAFVTNPADLVIDINGYFVPSTNTSALAFFPLTPCRIADTRNAAGALGGPSLTAGGTRNFPILSSACAVPSTAQAYSLNFAAVPKGPLGYLTAWPTGRSQPVVASLNAPTGTVVANAVIVPAGASGGVDVYATNPTDLVIDINGYFAPAGTGGLALYTSAPCRVLDSRLPAGTPPFTSTITVNVTASPCSVPSTAQAYVFNATVVPPGPLGYITMWPQGEPQPQVATLNALDGAITSNLAVVPTTNGSISVFPYDPTQLVLDLFGYFAP